MTWVAPQITRTEPAFVGDERHILGGFLDYQRQTLMGKCAGLAPEQLRRTGVEPSKLSLLGLVRHMAEVERAWFRSRFAGQQLDFLYFADARPDADFDEVATADAEADFTVFVQEVELVRQALAGRSLDETFFHARRKVEISLRWVYVHMIEEYARHNGHADLLRERIDGLTGE